MAVALPAVVVLVVCRVILGQPTENDKMTGLIPSEWDMSQGVMHCRALHADVYDAQAGLPSNPSKPKSEPLPEMTFNMDACRRTAITLGSQWDIQHMHKPWRLYRAACPTPVIDKRTGEIIKYVIPDCGSHNGTVECEQENEI